MNPKTIGALVAVIVLLCIVGVVVMSRVRSRSAAPRPNFAHRHGELLRLLKERPAGARFYVTVKGESRRRWHEVESSKRNELLLQSNERLSLDEVRAFVVTYPSGEVLATSMPQPSPKNLPAGAFFARPTDQGAGSTLTDEEVEQASADVKIVFGAVRTVKGRGNVYETRVLNKGKTPIRITHFGAYTKRGETWTLNTIVEGFFTAQQFQEWYGVPEDGWLAPGASGMDRENYGPNCLWVYFFETREGEVGKAIGQAPE
jgi:hypothetical protein